MKLKKEYKSGGYIATYVKHDGDIYMYKRTQYRTASLEYVDPDWSDCHYEVVIPIGRSGNSPAKHKYLYPRNSKWGDYGWTLTTKERANEKYNELIQANKESV